MTASTTSQVCGQSFKLKQLPQLPTISRFPSFSKTPGSGAGAKAGAQGLLIRVDAATTASAAVSHSVRRENSAINGSSDDARVKEASVSSPSASIDVHVRAPSRPFYQAGHNVASAYSFVTHTAGPNLPTTAAANIDVNIDIEATRIKTHEEDNDSRASPPVFDADAEYVRTNSRSIEPPPHGLRRLKEIWRREDRWVVMRGLVGKGVSETGLYVSGCVVDTMPGCMRRRWGWR